MKKTFLFLLPLLLSACESTPVVHSSFAGLNYVSPPTSFQDPRIFQPTFYRDDAEGGWWTHAATPGTR